MIAAAKEDWVQPSNLSFFLLLQILDSLPQKEVFVAEKVLVKQLVVFSTSSTTVSSFFLSLFLLFLFLVLVFIVYYLSLSLFLFLFSLFISSII
jgi:hypothetical protein